MTDWLGEQLGNYRLLRLLGQGGFGEVYLGEHKYLKTQAAIKVLQVKLVNEELEDFLQEARTIAGLRHPNIIRVLDFGTDRGTPFLVMEYAALGTVRQHFSRGTRLPLSTVVTYVKQVAAALEYAHGKKIVHRDVKPENILLADKDEILLSDFGIAFVAQSSRYQRTQEVIGTVAYMAPEQLQGKPRPASDQYALGIVVYEWLCGKRPFHGSFTEVYSQHLFVPPPPLHEVVPHISPDIEKVVLTALAKDFQQRFATIKAFATALEQASDTSIIPVSKAESTENLLLERTGTATLLPDQTSWPGSPTPLSQPESPIPPVTEEERQHTPSRFSRRIVVVSLVGLVVAGGTASLVLLPKLQSNLPPVPAPTQTAIIQPDPQPSSQPDPQPSAKPQPQPTTQQQPTTQPSQQPQPPAIGTTLLSYRGHSNWMTSVAWSPNSKYIASGSADSTAQVWNAVTGTTLNTYRGHSNGVNCVAWSPGGGRIASGGGTTDMTAQVWDTFTGGNVLIYRGHTNQVSAVAWSPDGNRIASGSWDRTVQVWDAATGNHILTYNGHTAELHDVEWSPDGRYIASASGDHTVQIWEATTGNTVISYRGHTDYVFKATWSPNGTYIASASHDQTAQVWIAMSGSTLTTYRGHTNEVNAVVWSPDGHYTASSGADRTVQKWNPTNGNTMYIYRGQNAKTNALAWSSDGSRIVSGDDSALVQVWEAI